MLLLFPRTAEEFSKKLLWQFQSTIILTTVLRTCILFLKMPGLLMSFFLLLSVHLFSQGSDLISVRKKNGVVIKTFFAGSPIVFETRSGSYIDGRIKEIKNDSVFTTIYHTGTFMTNLGVTVFDTVSTTLVSVHYRDIESIKVFIRHRTLRGKIDKLLMYGGAGYFGLNVINHVISGESLTADDNLKKLGIAAAVFGIGLIINKYFNVNRFSRKKHKIVYVKLT